jgi:hypothetical protein
MFVKTLVGKTTAKPWFAVLARGCVLVMRAQVWSPFMGQLFCASCIERLHKGQQRPSIVA